MFVISDVAQESDDFYPFPTSGSTGGLTIGSINLLARLLTLACALTVVLVGIDAWDTLTSSGFTFWDLFRYLVPLSLAGVTAGALWWGRMTIRREIGKIPHAGLAAWGELRRLRLGQVSEMLRLRITSLMAMASTIFMNRIRALGFQAIYANEALKGKRVSNLIYHLRPGRPFFFKKNRPDVPDPSDELQKIVETAATMPTTLWFDDDDAQRNLVITGQATLCYNLMKFLTRNCGRDPQAYPAEVKELWDGLVDDWTRLVKNPYELLDELLPGENTRL